MPPTRPRVNGAPTTSDARRESGPAASTTRRRWRLPAVYIMDSPTTTSGRAGARSTVTPHVAGRAEEVPGVSAHVGRLEERFLLHHTHSKSAESVASETALPQASVFCYVSSYV